MARHYVIIDTDVFRFICKCDFKDKFIELCQNCSIILVTILQIERQINKILQCKQFLNKLFSLNLIHKYSTPPKLIKSEGLIYKTLEPQIGEADAELIAVAVLNNYILLTNDKAAVTIFSKKHPELYQQKLRCVSFESLLYLAYQTGVINDQEGENFLQKFKGCFDRNGQQPKTIRHKNFLQLIEDMYNRGISPKKCFE